MYFSTLSMQHSSSSDSWRRSRSKPLWIAWKGICALPYAVITRFRNDRCTSTFSDTTVSYASTPRRAPT